MMAMSWAVAIARRRIVWADRVWALVFAGSGVWCGEVGCWYSGFCSDGGVSDEGDWAAPSGWKSEYRAMITHVQQELLAVISHFPST